MADTNYAYDDTNGSIRGGYNDYEDDHNINIELGPSTGSPDVTFTLLGAASVSDPTGAWTNNAKTFTAPSNDPIEVTATDAGGTEKKLWIKPKTNGGLPGGKPV